MNTIGTFKNLDALNKYSDTVKRNAQGEIVFIEDIQEYYMYDGDNWMPLPKAEAENDGLSMNLYDLNKSLIASLPAPTTDDLIEMEKTICNFDNGEADYFMLLCKDISYYTIFTAKSNYKEFKNLGEAVITCITESIGTVIAVDKTEDEVAIEIWVRTAENDVYCMYLFDATNMIVYYEG